MNVAPRAHDLLFVYGTLRRGCEQAGTPTLDGMGEWAGVAKARGIFFSIGWYPAFLPDPAGKWVLGDLFRMTKPAVALATLDRYEECSPDFPQPHEYRREIIEVSASGERVSAWAYVYNRPAGDVELIASGDWLNR